MIEPGMVFFSNNKKGLFPKLIRFFTESKISHSGLITHPLGGVASVQEASQVVQVVPFERYLKSKTEEYVVYRIKPELVSQDIMREALRQCHLEFSGVHYGVLQCVWFVYAWAYKKITKRKYVPRGKNWFTQGLVCSELIYWYLYKLGNQFFSLVRHFNPDTIQAQDLLDIVIANPQIFEKVLDNQK